MLLTYGKTTMSKLDSRFAYKPFKGRFGDGVFVLDASWITDAESREGKTSPTVFCADTIDEAVDFVQKAVNGEIKPEPHESNFCGWPELKKRVQRWYAAGKPG